MDKLQWLRKQVDKQVKLCYGPLDYEGLLRWNGNGMWMVRFHEFLPRDISSYGFDRNGQPYIVLVKETAL